MGTLNDVSGTTNQIPLAHDGIIVTLYDRIIGCYGCGICIDLVARALYNVVGTFDRHVAPLEHIPGTRNLYGVPFRDVINAFNNRLGTNGNGIIVRCR